MANATAQSVFTDGPYAALQVSVAEASGNTVHYIGRVLMDDAWAAMSTAQKKAALVAAVKAARDTQQQAAPALPAITGTVVV